jgi:hypothetical protein
VAAQSEAWVCGSSLLGMRVRISPGLWMSISYKCCILSSRVLCGGYRAMEIYYSKIIILKMKINLLCAKKQILLHTARIG